MYCYQTYDRASLKFTNVPLYTIYQPQPPAPPPEEPNANAEDAKDVEPPAADNAAESAPGTYFQGSEFNRWIFMANVCRFRSRGEQFSRWIGCSE